LKIKNSKWTVILKDDDDDKHNSDEKKRLKLKETICNLIANVHKLVVFHKLITQMIFLMLTFHTTTLLAAFFHGQVMHSIV
jgi:hypothetical protein